MGVWGVFVVLCVCVLVGGVGCVCWWVCGVWFLCGVCVGGWCGVCFLWYVCVCWWVSPPTCGFLQELRGFGGFEGLHAMCASHLAFFSLSFCILPEIIIINNIH